MAEILCIDPGNTTGWCRIKDDTIYAYGHVKEHDFHAWLDDARADFMVIENYLIRPDGHSSNKSGFKHAWSESVTIQFIGAIKYACHLDNIPYIMQAANIKPVAAGFSMGRVPYVKGKSGQHHWDAMLHGIFYLVKTLKMSPESIKIGELSVGT